MHVSLACHATSASLLIAPAPPQTAVLQCAVLSIFDMTHHFSECFVAFTGDTMHDISGSHQSLVILRHHRSRRAWQQRKNIIDFTQASRDAAWVVLLNRRKYMLVEPQKNLLNITGSSRRVRITKHLLMSQSR
ncbi:hypothetical protein B0H21DRAFT_225578 [Amylocystis lapponica]|nr:hypothetical protein B0H21DRAFT_225578 [Amylocystis lapponica]